MGDAVMNIILYIAIYGTSAVIPMGLYAYHLMRRQIMKRATMNPIIIAAMFTILFCISTVLWSLMAIVWMIAYNPDVIEAMLKCNL